ncbi:MAG: helix-turn-helix domain-containing protein [Candidatus Spechtbacterales bacterium]|nr:helix-turn-helix domain-containing protein [Candidatus Spechtbacterales bacterium]
MSNQIKTLASKLEPLGLSDKQARVYVATLFLGSAPVQQIAKQADINRPTAYVILEELENMGLVSESTDAKKTVYIAEDPEAITRWLEKKEIEIEAKKKSAKKLISDLEGIKREEVSQAPMVRFYRGKEGIKSILAESARKSKPKTEVYGFTNLDEVKKLFPGYFKSAPERRLPKDISSKVLYSSLEKIDLENKEALRRARRVDNPIEADISIYEDRATLLTYAGENSSGIVIESPEIVKSLRQLFELAWESKE